MSHKKATKRSSEKQFVKTMVITGVLGMSIMMITMLFALKIFGAKKVSAPEKALIPKTIETPAVTVNATIQGVVHQVDYSNETIKIWDIQKNQYVEMQIKAETQLEDSYGKPIVIQEIQVGEIIETTYNTNTKAVVLMQKSASAWTKSDINNADIDISNQTIVIGNQTYDYTSNIIVTKDNGEVDNVSSIGEFDTLMIKGSNNTIWSIRVLQSPGYIQLSNAPAKEGTIEIDNNRIYTFEEIKENIPLSAGEHKVVIKMRGYEPFVDTINIIKDQVYTINLKDIKQAMTNLSINVTNTASPYTVLIDNKRYKKGESLKLPAGKYMIKLAAKDFEPFEQEIQLEPGDQLLDVTLKPQVKNSEDQSKEEKPKENASQESKQVQITIETEPIGAQVYVNGVHKGITPALTTLKPGEYNISIEKEGYTTLNTIIVIDGAANQRSFLYTLQKE